MRKLTCGIGADEGRPEVDEHSAAKATDVGADECDRRGGRPADGVGLEGQLERKIDRHHHLVVGQAGHRERACQSCHTHGRVKLLHRLDARLCPIRPDHRLRQVEVRATVRRAHRRVVVQRDRLHVREDGVLGGLGAEAVEAGDEHRRALELLHRLAAVHRHLPRLQVLVDRRGEGSRGAAEVVVDRHRRHAEGPRATGATC